MRAQLLPYILPLGSRLRDALEVLERGAGFALVVDDGKLIGGLTDSDSRRMLLAGSGLDTPLSADLLRATVVTVPPEMPRRYVVALMQQSHLLAVPVMDSTRTLHGIHFLRESIGEARVNCAVVMCGGRGRRLAPLTDELPKPLLRVAGRPILEHIVLHLRGHGFRTIYLAINYLGHLIEEHFGDGASFGVEVRYLREAHSLGTGGALSLLPEAPSAPTLVMNGDLITQADLSGMIAFHEASAPSVTVGVLRYLHTVPFGCVEAEGDRLVSMVEKPTLSKLVNGGIYVLSSSVISTLEREQELSMPQMIEASMRRGERVSCFEIEGDWIDVGQRDQLARARGE